MADYGDLDGVKRRIGKNTGETDLDGTLNEYLEEGDEFINTRVTLMNGSATTLTDQELDALNEGYAAAQYNYWTSPSKSMDGMKHYETKIINFLKAKYSGTLDETHTQDTFSKTSSSITGRA